MQVSYERKTMHHREGAPDRTAARPHGRTAARPHGQNAGNPQCLANHVRIRFTNCLAFNCNWLADRVVTFS